MKFTNSPTIPLKVGDTTLTLQQDNGSMHVGTSVWPCSLVLTKFIDRWSSSSSSSPNYSTILDFRNKRAVELGAGCGAVGMGVYLLGLHDVVLTDILPVMPALKHNLKKNKSVLNKSLKIAQLYWGNHSQMKALSPPFDIVLAADVVYLVETVRPLVETMRELVKDDGVVMLGYQVRCPDADVLFWETVREFFEIEKVKKEDLHPEYAYEETDVYIFRKKKVNNPIM
ncbi:hypothetical protein RND81_09G084000 [Saponaria officinalis]|uniref:Uncharacterized protein n=1 Tax=Saponaria officinalis TaxID=3572 RepID=A0AAW1IKG3_SAPOF